MSIENPRLVILSTHTEAENARKELQRSNFKIEKLNIAGKDYHAEEHAAGCMNSRSKRISFWNGVRSSVLCLLLLTGFTAAAITAELPVELGRAADYAVLAYSTVTNTGPTTINGYVGVSPLSAVVGLDPGGPGYVAGGVTWIHAADTAAANAQFDLGIAYTDAAGRTTAPTNVNNANLGGMTLYPGLYKSTGTLEISSGDLILDASGDPNAVFIFQIASSLTVTNGRKVFLQGSAQSSNIFWQVGSNAIFGTTSVFKGTIMAYAQINFQTGATLDGRALSKTEQVTLDSNTIDSITPTPNAAPVASAVSFSGTLKAGQILSGTYTYFDADKNVQGNSILYWYRADDSSGTNKTLVASATAYALTLADQGKYITFEVTPVAAAGTIYGTTVASGYQGPVNVTPVASAVSFSGTLKAGQTLTGTYTYFDADSDLQGTSTFVWFRSDNNSGLNKATISGATAITYALTTADLGKYISFEVTPVALTGTSPGAVAASGYQGPVVNSAPVASAVSFSGTLKAGLTLTGTYTYSDVDSDLQGTSTFVWYRSDNNSGLNKAAISGATTVTYVLTLADQGKYISFEVMPVALTGTSPGAVAVSGYQGPVNSAPLASAVTFSGTLKAGQTLTGTYTYSDVDSDLQGTSTFVWYRSDNNSGLNKAAISGANAVTYVLTLADQGKYISFEVTPVALTGTSPGAVAVSGYQGPANSAPVASAVAFSGTLIAGQILSGTYSYSDVDSDVQGNSTFTWYRADNDSGLNNAVISGATAITYMLTVADQGKYISFEVTPVALTGTSPGTAAASIYHGSIQAPPTPTATNTYTPTPSPTNTNTPVPGNSSPVASAVTFSGTLMAGQIQSGTYTYSDVDNDTQGTSIFTWYRADNGSGLNKAAISGATATTYALTVADQGKFISFEVIPVAQTGTSPGTAAASVYRGPILAAPTPTATSTNTPGPSPTNTPVPPTPTNTNTPVPGNSPPVASAVAFSGTLMAGQIISGTYSYSDVDNDVQGISIFTWYRADNGSGLNKAAIAGATAITYMLTVADQGKYISFEVTPVAQTGTSPGTAAASVYHGSIQAAPTPTATNTYTPGPSPTNTNTPVPPTATNTYTPTPSPANTNTPAPPTATNTYTPGPSPTNTNTPVPPTPTNTNTPVPGNNPPAASAVSFSGILKAGQTLTGTYTYFDADNDLQGTSTFAWYRAADGNGTGKTLIVGANAITYALTTADQGKYISFEVTPVAQTGTTHGAAVASVYQGPVNSAPVASLVSFSGTLKVGQTLTGTYTYFDADSDLQGTSTFTWYRSANADGSGGVPIASANAISYLLTAADQGKYISFAVTPVAQTGTTPGGAAASVYQGPVDNSVPVASAVAFSGVMKVGKTLTGTYTYSDLDSDLQGTSTFAWYRAADGNGTGKTLIVGANAITYVQTLVDLGKYISFAVTPVAMTGTTPGTAAASAYQGPVANSAPVASAVAISGMLKVGKILTGNYLYSDADSDAEGTSTFAWYRAVDSAGTGRTLISGTNAISYVLTSADMGKYISFEVTPVAQTGILTGVAAASVYQGQGPVANSMPVASVVAIHGALNVGQTLTGTYTYFDVDGDAQGISQFAWYRAADGIGTGKTLIVGANAITYVVTSADLGKYISFEVTPVAQTGTTPGAAAASVYQGQGPVTNSAPFANAVSISGALIVGQTLTGSYTYSDTESDLQGTSTFAWYRAATSSGAEKTLIVGENAITYVQTLLDQGKYLSFEVTPVAMTGTTPGAAAASAYQGPVDNSAPIASAVSFSGTLKVGHILTGTYLYFDTDSDAQGTSTFAWYRAADGSGTGKTLIAGANAIAYMQTTADLGKYISFAVTPVAQTGKTPGVAAVSAYQGPVTNSAPVASEVSFSGTLKAGQTLTGTYLYFDADNDAQGASTFAWYRAVDGIGTGKTLIAGANAITYVLPVADLGKYLSFEVTPAAQTGILRGAAAASVYQGPVANSAPVASAVSLNGTLKVGQTLSGTYSYFDVDNDAQGPSTFAWYRADNSSGLNKTVIIGANAITYVQTMADLGKYISFEVIPVAKTGTSPGTVVSTAYQGAIQAASEPSSPTPSPVHATPTATNTHTPGTATPANTKTPVPPTPSPVHASPTATNTHTPGTATPVNTQAPSPANTKTPAPPTPLNTPTVTPTLIPTATATLVGNHPPVLTVTASQPLENIPLNTEVSVTVLVNDDDGPNAAFIIIPSTAPVTINSSCTIGTMTQKILNLHTDKEGRFEFNVYASDGIAVVTKTIIFNVGVTPTATNTPVPSTPTVNNTPLPVVTPFSNNHCNTKCSGCSS